MVNKKGTKKKEKLKREKNVENGFNTKLKGKNKKGVKNINAKHQGDVYIVVLNGNL